MFKKLRHNREALIARALKCNLLQKKIQSKKNTIQYCCIVQFYKTIQRHCFTRKNIAYKYFVQLKETFRQKYNKRICEIRAP